jgi:hypothetical protein
VTTKRRPSKRKLTITERGWAGHFICANDCRYRRNTLISDGEHHVVVSSVGNMWYSNEVRKKTKDMDDMQEIGVDRYYETIVWHGHQDGHYIEADISAQIATGDDVPSGIHARDLKMFPDDVDLRADTIHEANVRWVVEHWKDAVAARRS